MKRSRLTWYLLAALLALVPVGIRVMTWKWSWSQPVDPAMAQAGEELFKHEWMPGDPLAEGLHLCGELGMHELGRRLLRPVPAEPGQRAGRETRAARNQVRGGNTTRPNLITVSRRWPRPRRGRIRANAAARGSDLGERSDRRFLEGCEGEHCRLET